MTLPTDMKKLRTSPIRPGRIEGALRFIPKGCARCAHELAQSPHDSIRSCAVAEDTDSAWGYG